MENDGLDGLVKLGVDRVGSNGTTKNIKDGIASLIDHTLLKPDAKKEDITKICSEARTYGFASCCVNPYWIPLVARLLRGSSIKTCSVVGFPLGAMKPEVKAFEARRCVIDGAQELDMVINIGALKSGDFDTVEYDIKGVVISGGPLVLVKVILETALLTDEEKIRACLLAKSAGAHFVKTSTGFGPSGATPEDVNLMKKVVDGGMGVKAAGGIRTYERAMEMVKAGASRIGASASVKIVKGRK